MFKPITIEDARGQRIAFLVDPESPILKGILKKGDYRSFILVYAEDVDGIDPLNIKKRKSFRNAHFYIGMLGIVILCALILVILLAFVLLGLVNSPRSFWGTTMSSSILLTYIWFAARKRWRLRSMNTQRPCVRMLMDFRCCPACMYSLAGLAVESDGCTVCPECGGAWRLPVESA